MRVYFGVDIGGTNIKAALVSEEGSLKIFRSMPWSVGPASDAVATAVRLLEDVTASEPGHEIISCGAASAGLVDTEAGIVRLSPNLPEWRDVQLGRMLEDALKLPTTLENDANAAAYAEYVLGAARGATNAIVLTLGTGIGGGLILGGRLYRGGGFAGEVGHTVIERDGEPCPCGNTGCLERYANAEALVNWARQSLDAGASSTLSGEALTAKEIGRAANAGDAVALAAVREVGRALGVGLANLALTLDPDVIVLGGGVAEAGEPLFAAACDEMARRAYGSACSLPRLVRAELGETAGVVGAALLARDELPST